MDITDYYKNGFSVISNVIPRDDLDRLKLDITNYINRDGDRKKIFTFPESLFRLIDLRFYRRTGFARTGIPLALKLLKLTHGKEMRRIKSTLKLSKLLGIDFYLTESTNKEITKWHCDQSFGGATDPGLYFNGNLGKLSTTSVTKVFYHLTDVRPGDGAFAYLPRSHYVGVAIRHLINSGAIPYEPFTNLENAFDLVNRNYRLLLEIGMLTTDDLDFFLENSQRALDKTIDFSLKIDAGGLVIFNDLGFHQGTAPSLSSRLVLRYWY